MPKANPLGNLDYEVVTSGHSGAGTGSEFREGIVKSGELHPAPGPTSRDALELTIDGLSGGPTGAVDRTSGQS